ncbi:MAG TPA: DUF58 domain-containing protein [Mycobacteriales bacterium]|nr:DUF58 domain-containing protein [Mycobacteriales bacterium]
MVTPEPAPPRWRPTAALARAVVLGGVLLLLAVLLRRPDLVVLAAPLLLGVGIGLAARPTGVPALTLAGPVDALLEGGRAAAIATIDMPAGVDVAAVGIVLPAGLEPLTGVSAILVEGRREVRLTFRAVRWGRRQAGPAYLRATGGYGTLSWPVVLTSTVSVTTWPLRDGFDAAETVPRAEGLVGAHRSRRAGEGGDVAGVRPFQPGDRLRRINWRVTARTGDLHVTATYSDRDTEVLLVLDSGQDLGRRPETSLDTGVRAAAAVAEHYLRAGDRVGFVDLGRPQRPVPARNGRNHLVRMLDVLLDAKPQGGGALPSLAEVAYLGSTDALVVLLSPLATVEALAAVATLSRSGRSVVAVDTLPPDLLPDERSPWTALAFRLWLLRRDADLGRLAELGVPRVAWRGSGSLDAVLRDATLAARAARAAR